MTNSETIFQQAGGLTPYKGEVCRVVETQEYAATLSLVDNLDEQAELESILDEYKPSYVDGTHDRHYLISTPFRYPPLRYGSRFGTTYEPSYFYGSETVGCCLAEAAFYRFVLIDGTEKPFDMVIQSQHSLFWVDVQTPGAVDLCTINDAAIQAMLKHPASYAGTQELGRYSRDNGANLIRYFSARCGNEGVNVAIDDHNIIKSSSPHNMVSYLCEIDPLQGVVRYSAPRTFPVTFRKEQFLINGALPFLA